MYLDGINNLGILDHTKSHSMSEYRLKDMPADVKQILLKVQAEKKIEKNMLQYSIEAAIYSVVREYDKLKPKQAS